MEPEPMENLEREENELVERLKDLSADGDDGEDRDSKPSVIPSDAKEFFVLEYPSGLKLTLATSLFNIYDLANLALQLLDKIKPSDKLSEGYLG